MTTTMTNEEIIRMAWEAGLFDSLGFDAQGLERFAALVAEATKAQPQGEPVAWRVTGPFEDVPFKDRSSAEAYRKGLNNGYGSDAYTVSPIYTTPPSSQRADALVEAAIEATKEEFIEIVRTIGGKFAQEAEAAIRSMK